MPRNTDNGQVIDVDSRPASQAQQPADPSLLCSKHPGKKWFKSAKMTAYAHPGGDNGQWCNMSDVLADQEVSAEQYQREEDQRFQEAMELDGPSDIDAPAED